jgi:hypothetical protein
MQQCKNCYGAVADMLAPKIAEINQHADTIQQQAERIRGLESQRDKFYGEANIEREAAATYKLVLDQLVEILGEIPYGDIVGTVALREQQLSEVVEYAGNLKAALHRISLGSVHSANSKADLGMEARAATALPLPKAMQPTQPENKS